MEYDSDIGNSHNINKPDSSPCRAVHNPDSSGRYTLHTSHSSVLHHLRVVPYIPQNVVQITADKKEQEVGLT